MDCRNCLCQKTDRELSISEGEAKKIFIQSRQQMGKSILNQNLSKARQEKKSLKRSTITQKAYLPDSRLSISYNIPEPREKVLYYQRPISENFKISENEIQLQKYPIPMFLATQYLNNDSAGRNKFRLPNQNQAGHFNEKYFHSRNEKPITSSSLNQYQNHHNIQNLNPLHNRPFLSSNLIENQSRINEQFKLDLERVLNQQKPKQILKSDQKAVEKKKTSSFLKPNQDASIEIQSSKLSRSPSGIRNIEDIVCTKTQSVGSSSSSSEFSQIIFHQMPTELKSVKKMTNSSINFAKQHDDFAVTQMPEALGEAGKKGGRKKIFQQVI